MVVSALSRPCRHLFCADRVAVRLLTYTCVLCAILGTVVVFHYSLTSLLPSDSPVSNLTVTAESDLTNALWYLKGFNMRLSLTFRSCRFLSGCLLHFPLAHGPGLASTCHRLRTRLLVPDRELIMGQWNEVPVEEVVVSHRFVAWLYGCFSYSTFKVLTESVSMRETRQCIVSSGENPRSVCLYKNFYEKEHLLIKDNLVYLRKSLTQGLP